MNNSVSSDMYRRPDMYHPPISDADFEAAAQLSPLEGAFMNEDPSVEAVAQSNYVDSITSTNAVPVADELAQPRADIANLYQADAPAAEAAPDSLTVEQHNLAAVERAKVFAHGTVTLRETRLARQEDYELAA